jgi:hypothetical protein
MPPCFRTRPTLAVDRCLLRADTPARRTSQHFTVPLPRTFPLGPEGWSKNSGAAAKDARGHGEGPDRRHKPSTTHCGAIRLSPRCTVKNNFTDRLPVPQASPNGRQRRDSAAHTTGAQPPPRRRLPPTLYVCQTRTRRPQAKPRHTQMAPNKSKRGGTHYPPQAC